LLFPAVSADNQDEGQGQIKGANGPPEDKQEKKIHIGHEPGQEQQELLQWQPSFGFSFPPDPGQGDGQDAGVIKPDMGGKQEDPGNQRRSPQCR